MGRCSGRGSGASLEDMVQDLAKRGTGEVAGISSCLVGRRENGAATAVCVRCDKRVDPRTQRGYIHAETMGSTGWRKRKIERTDMERMRGHKPLDASRAACACSPGAQTDGRWKMEIPAKGGGRHRLLY